MNAVNKPFGTMALAKSLAVAATAIVMMMPLAASAHHDRHDIVEALVGAAVVYTIIESLDRDDDRYDRYRRTHRPYHHHHNRHYDAWHYGPRVGHHRKHASGKHRAKHHRYDKHRRHDKYDRKYRHHGGVHTRY